MDDPDIDSIVKRNLFRQAIDAHVAYTVRAMNFEAVDRHLLGLRLTAKENGMPIPKLFRSRAFRCASHFELSTSQVPSKNEALLCFGPVVVDGYGLCYNPMEKKFLCAISSSAGHPRTDSSDFGEEIRKAFDDVRSLMMETSSSTNIS